MKPKIKKQIINRLKRIEGQIRGIQKMVDEEKYCIDTITQSSAVKEALTGVEGLLLENHMGTHIAQQMKSGQTKKATSEVMKVYKLSQKNK